VDRDRRHLGVAVRLGAEARVSAGSDSGSVGSSLQGGRTERRDREGTETAAIARAADLDGKRVLDVGCGTGRLTAFAAERAAYVYAFDPSEESVAEAEASLAPEERTRVEFAVHDADALDVPRRRFDLALCGWSL
jgi:ubiquinone/menaquinone biosynthesis C-methylase UbiE